MLILPLYCSFAFTVSLAIHSSLSFTIHCSLKKKVSQQYTRNHTLIKKTHMWTSCEYVFERKSRSPVISCMCESSNVIQSTSTTTKKWGTRTVASWRTTGRGTGCRRIYINTINNSIKIKQTRFYHYHRDSDGQERESKGRRGGRWTGDGDEQRDKKGRDKIKGGACDSPVPF